jgi:hypothetical protein
MLGGLFSGLLVFTFVPEAEGHGTDAVVSAFHHTAGKLRLRVVPLKMLASAITIGSGGSAGREGPTALISAGIGSAYGKLGARTEHERRLLLLIGAAAGLSAIFRSPIGSALFVVEVLYGDMEFEAAGLLYAMLASIVAFAVNGFFVGHVPLFDIQRLACAKRRRRSSCLKDRASFGSRRAATLRSRCRAGLSFGRRHRRGAISRDERVMGAAGCTPHLTALCRRPIVLASSGAHPLLPSRCPSRLAASLTASIGRALNRCRKATCTSPSGFAVLVHHLSFIDRREAAAGRFMSLPFDSALAASAVTIIGAGPSNLAQKLAVGRGQNVLHSNSSHRAGW